MSATCVARTWVISAASRRSLPAQTRHSACGIVLAFLLQHAVQSSCPPLVVIRWLGVHSASEIDVEKYALKALRGYFVDIKKDQAAAGRAAVRDARA